MCAFFRRWLLAAVGLIALTPFCRADSHAVTRLAIVDVGAQPGSPAFVDLLTVALSRESTVGLLEREKVEQLLH